MHLRTCMGDSPLDLGYGLWRPACGTLKLHFRFSIPALVVEFEHQARMLDPHGFAAVTATTEDADMFDWLQWKLRHGLSSWRKPGKAAWKWMTPGKVAKVLVWCTGARESEQTAPYAGEHQYGAQWWPCIVHIPDGDPLAPVLAFYCPALGWANGRPWLVHRSRCFLVPNDYRDIATK